MKVTIQWMAWSDNGVGLYAGDSPFYANISPNTTCAMLSVLYIPRDAPPFYNAVWKTDNNDFLHNPQLTLAQYGIKDGASLTVILRCAGPL